MLTEDDGVRIEIRLGVARELGERHGVSAPMVDRLRPLLAVLPPFISRTQMLQLTGLDMSHRTLANLDAEGRGPRLRLNLSGRSVAYPTAYFLEWLESRGLDVVARKAV